MGGFSYEEVTLTRTLMIGVGYSHSITKVLGDTCDFGYRPVEGIYFAHIINVYWMGVGGRNLMYIMDYVTFTIRLSQNDIKF